MVPFYSVCHTVNGHSADGTRAGEAILSLDFHISLIKTVIFIIRLTWLYVKSALWNLLPFVLSARLWRAIEFLPVRFMCVRVQMTAALRAPHGVLPRGMIMMCVVLACKSPYNS